MSPAPPVFIPADLDAIHEHAAGIVGALACLLRDARERGDTAAVERLGLLAACAGLLYEQTRAATGQADALRRETLADDLERLRRAVG